MRKEVVDKIVDAITKATLSSEFEEQCKQYIQKNLIPPGVLDFWYTDCRNFTEAYQANFLMMLRQKMLQHVTGNVLYVPTTQLMVQDWKSEKSLAKTGKKVWEMAHNEAGNDKKFEEYHPTVEDQIGCAFHSLNTAIGFDSRLFATKRQFGLHLSVQPAVNNRDIELREVTNVHYQGEHDYSLFEFVANMNGTQDASDDRFITSDGLFVLVERKRRSSIDDEKIKNILAPYHHMWKMQTTDGNKADRRTGVKIVGDHVAMRCTKKTMEDFFVLLTVSLNLENPH